MPSSFKNLVNIEYCFLINFDSKLLYTGVGQNNINILFKMCLTPTVHYSSDTCHCGLPTAI